MFIVSFFEKVSGSFYSGFFSSLLVYLFWFDFKITAVLGINKYIHTLVILFFLLLKKKYHLIKNGKESLVLCDSPNNTNDQMERRQIAQTLANVLPGTRIGSQVMYQQQKVKLAMNINHNEALNQLSM